MSFVRALLARRAERETRPPTWLDPATATSVEEYAFRLMWHGVETGRARELLRAAVTRQRQQDAEASQRPRHQVRDDLEGRRDSCSAAAAKLLREAGWLDPDEVAWPPVQRPPQDGSFMGAWLPGEGRTEQAATMTHDPLLDGPRPG